MCGIEIYCTSKTRARGAALVFSIRKAVVGVSVFVVAAVPFLQFESFGTEDLGYPFLVNGECGPSPGDSVEEEGFEVLHLALGWVGFNSGLLELTRVRQTLMDTRASENTNRVRTNLK